MILDPNNNDLDRVLKEDYLKKHPEILNFWLGDAANEKSRIKLHDACRQEQKLLESVLNYWEWSKTKAKSSKELHLYKEQNNVHI